MTVQLVEDDSKMTSSAPRGRVLIVDDEPGLLRAYKRGLKASGYEIEVAENGHNAIDVFRSGSFHCIVSDISMPNMDGLELLREVRKFDLDVPVILATGIPSLDTAIKALDYGALKYLVKPIEIPNLVKELDHAVYLYRIALMKRQALEMLGEGDKQIGDRAGLEVKFESALWQIFMSYQPIVRWSTRTVDGYETLVRSSEPTIGNPAALFEAAERLDRVFDLSRTIRRLAPIPIQDNPDRGRLFFNLHTMDLMDPTLFDPNSSLVAMADRVVLEVSERASLSAVSDARNRVARLREMGFQIAVDDLGAGYAGLGSFAMLEPDVVKFDMALIRDIDKSPTKQKLVRSMTHLCSDMGLEVVAEGVETVAEREALVDLGCDLLQGYLFAKPGPPFSDVEWE